MPRTCTVCNSPARKAIDHALVAGEPTRALAARYGPLSRTAIQRHAEEHLPQSLVKAKAADDTAAALDVVSQLKAINDASMGVLQHARAEKNGPLQLAAIDRVQRQIELQAKLLGTLDERPVVNVVLSPQWLAIRAVIVQTLSPFPDARQAVAEALGALEEATQGEGANDAGR